MSYTSVSKCPLCRSEFTHLPRVSELLHTLLQTKFPVKYRTRAVDTVEFEAEQEIESMSTDPNQEEGGPSSGAEEEEAKVEECDEMFKCDKCGERLFHPCIVSPCSHCLCGLCAGVYEKGEEGEGSGGRSRASSQPLRTCPVCDCTLVAPPKVCHILNNYLVKKFGNYEEQANLRRRMSTPFGSPQTRACIPCPPPDRDRDGGDGCPCCSDEAADMDASAAAPGEEGANGEVAPQDHQGATEQELEANLQDRIIQVLKSPCDTVSPENFVHFGVGCDGCGVCPIVGRRYKCLECEEKIGFDLCAQCHQSHRGPGRFNQQHRPEHKMVLVEPKETFLHALLKSHPGFTPEYLLDLLNGMYSDV